MCKRIRVVLLESRKYKKRRGTRTQLAKVGLTAERTKEAIRRGVDAVALGDIRKMFDVHGNVRPITELEDAEAVLIGGFEVVIKSAFQVQPH
jgi:hypothetical protein